VTAEDSSSSDEPGSREHLSFVLVQLTCLVALWGSIVTFAAAIAYTALKVGHLPTFNHPDPKGVLPAFVQMLVSHSLVVGAFAGLFVIPLTLVRIANPAIRPRVRSTALAVAGTIVYFVLLAGFFDWWAD
jgi:hypothetical protein